MGTRRGHDKARLRALAVARRRRRHSSQAYGCRRGKQPTNGGPRVWVIPTALLPVHLRSCAGRTGVMDWNVLLQCQCRRFAPALVIPHLIRANLRWMVIKGWMLAAFILLLVPAGLIPSDQSEVALEAYRQDSLRAHPEWPPDMRAAAMAGIICVGMPADMVRVAWGHPTRTSGRGGPGQRETWYYAGRPSAVERLSSQGMNDAGTIEWTVSFIDGQVVAWTD